MSAKVMIVYQSKYGNAKLVAETIAEGMREVEGVEAVVTEALIRGLQNIASVR
jgi:flavodoxin